MTTSTTAGRLGGRQHADEEINDLLAAAWTATDPAAIPARRRRAAPALSAIVDLTNRLDRCQHEQAVTDTTSGTLRDRLDQFHAALRRRVIQAVNDRDIGRQAASEALADLGLPPLHGCFDATVELDITVDLVAADRNAARQAARDAIRERCKPLSDSCVPSPDDFHIDHVRLLDPAGCSAEATDAAVCYRVQAAFRATISVSADREDDARRAAIDTMRERIGWLDQVHARDPRCTTVDEADCYVDPDND
jgi:hypothetical protein